MKNKHGVKTQVM